MFSGNEVNNSLQFKLFWAVGSSRLKEQKKEKEEMLKSLSCVGRALGHSSPTTFSEVESYFTREETEAQS